MCISAENEKYRKSRAIEQQKKVIAELEQQYMIKESRVSSIKDRMKKIKKELAELDIVKMDIDNIVHRNVSILTATLIVAAIIIVAFSVYIAVKHSVVLGIISSVWPVPVWFITFLCGKKITFEMIKCFVEKKTREKHESIRRYSENQVAALRKELEEVSGENKTFSDELSSLEIQIKQEQEKLKELGVDPLLIEEPAL